MPYAQSPTRSWLFTPATRPDRFAKAAKSGADVVILDLEDAVAQVDKERARLTAIEFLKTVPPVNSGYALRINGLDTKAGIADLQSLLDCGAAPRFLVLPKTESADHLRILDRLMTTAGRDTRLIALVESARGLMAAEAIVTATPRLAGLMLGAADLAADLTTAPSWEALAYARGRIVAACALVGIPAIDAPFFDVHDLAAGAEEASRAAALGFQAKAAIHPAQIEAINAALTPSDQAVAEAKAILAENAKGVGTVGGQMVDEAVARRARHTLAMAGQTL